MACWPEFSPLVCRTFYDKGGDLLTPQLIFSEGYYSLRSMLCVIQDPRLLSLTTKSILLRFDQCQSRDACCLPRVSLAMG